MARVSVGSAFAWVALAGLVEAGRELLEAGTYGFTDRVAVGWAPASTAFTRG